MRRTASKHCSHCTAYYARKHPRFFRSVQNQLSRGHGSHKLVPLMTRGALAALHQVKQLNKHCCTFPAYTTSRAKLAQNTGLQMLTYDDLVHPSGVLSLLQGRHDALLSIYTNVILSVDATGVELIIRNPDNRLIGSKPAATQLHLRTSPWQTRKAIRRIQKLPLSGSSPSTSLKDPQEYATGEGSRAILKRAPDLPQWRGPRSTSPCVWG